MRTKTLLCAATLAAGVATSMAQSNVYSLNIVGYANVPILAGNNIYGNPFDKDGTNNAGQILNVAPLSDAGGNPGLDAFFLSTWDTQHGGFKTVYYEQDFTSGNTGGAVTNGWATDGTGSAQGVPPNLPPGTGFFINNGGALFTNVFVGNVVPNPGATNHMTIVAGNQLVNSPTPFQVSATGDYTGYKTTLQLPLAPLSDAGGQPGLDAFFLSTWDTQHGGYKTVYYEQDFTSNNTGGAVTNGWATDGTGSAQGVVPPIGIAQGFFINNGGPVVSWDQTLTNSP